MNHVDIIQMCINALSAQVYLEIGVSKGVNFAKICAPYKIGVDPIPAKPLIQKITDASCRYYAVTSDEFFNNFFNHFDGVYMTDNKRLLDVVFIDGLHEYNQALRDVENALSFLNDKGIIILHDSSPTSAKVGASVSEWRAGGSRGAWTGDVWKSVVRLRSTHNDLNIFTLNCDWGCAVITRGNPESMLNYTDEQIENMTYEDFAQNKDVFLNLKEPQYLHDFLKNRNKSELHKQDCETFRGSDEIAPLKKTIFAVSMVKNESDTIESFCRYTLTFCDGIILHDDGSTDNTMEIILKLLNEFPQIFLDRSEQLIGYPQKLIINRMINKAIQQHNADVIIPLDADEYLIHKNGVSPRAELEILNENCEYQVLWKTYVYTNALTDNRKFLPNNFKYYRHSKYERFYKTIVSKKIISEYKYEVTQGSHKILPTFSNSPNVKTIKHKELLLCHFPLRSISQTMSKIIIGWSNYLCMTNRGNKSYHWRQIYNIIKSKGKLTAEEVTRLSSTYALHNIESEEIELVEDSSAIINQDICLKYTDYSLNNNYIEKILSHFEMIINNFLKQEVCYQQQIKQLEFQNQSRGSE